ncbi:MAG: type II toxin-antitoxin system Phd/YefM family antitoxin [Desulfobacterales bacterium]|nr:type II toxin-antitoxin system Phd/YefM family antitoxin [Desulfobacterales bacterium]
MESVGVSQFREKLPFFIEKVKKGATITITSRGREVARLVPAEDERAAARQALARLAQTAEVGDVLAPISADWDALA